jgi:hypothetical protein
LVPSEALSIVESNLMPVVGLLSLFRAQSEKRRAYGRVENQDNLVIR